MTLALIQPIVARRHSRRLSIAGNSPVVRNCYIDETVCVVCFLFDVWWHCGIRCSDSTVSIYCKFILQLVVNLFYICRNIVDFSGFVVYDSLYDECTTNRTSGVWASHGRWNAVVKVAGCECDGLANSFLLLSDWTGRPTDGRLCCVAHTQRCCLAVAVTDI